MIQWHNLHHSELTLCQLYALLQLRCKVFIIEQNCLFQDIDGEDLVGENRHIIGMKQGNIVAYARILKSSDSFDPIVIGRVIISPELRGQRLGEQLMRFTLEVCQQQWPNKAIYLGAQAHLQHFYSRFGFSAVTPEYDEDGILHIGMAKEVSSETDESCL